MKNNKKRITMKDIEDKTEELIELIKNLEEDKSDAASHVCYEVITWGSYNHYEGLGILAEVLIRWRNRSIEVMEEEASEENCKCDDCNNSQDNGNNNMLHN